MLNLDHKKAQAALELAVFGAILIFLLGTIVRTAAGNNYTQDQNFKAMRMALLSSWQSSEANSMSRSSASVFIVEDRLSPDFNKYGDIDRNPFIANGAGTFTYQLLYPMDPDEVSSNLPIMDMYINGVHFPLTLATYYTMKQVPGPNANCSASASTCEQNQCLRNKHEWVGGFIKESQFQLLCPIQTKGTTAAQRLAQETSNADEIFELLGSSGLIGWPATGSHLASQSIVVTMSTTQFNTAWTIFSAGFNQWYQAVFPVNSKAQARTLKAIRGIIGNGTPSQYKLFYTQVANPGDAPGASSVTPAFSTVGPATCASFPCKDQMLTQDLTVLDKDEHLHNNSTWDMQYDLGRTEDYATVDANFPPAPNSCTAASMRCNMAWQWAATAGVSAAAIGLNTTTNQYPNYDIDGRLKEVTIYDIRWSPPNLFVSYEDMQNGDMDQTWDSNSCGAKPGLQPNSLIYTFTKDGTYLLINEGKLYNPETGQVVRSASKRDSADLIERTIQLSNNTYRFCSQYDNSVLQCVGQECPGGGTNCSLSQMNPCPVGATNPIEVCVNSSTQSGGNCRSLLNVRETCFDAGSDKIYVRSRLQDLRGHFWMTNASGQLKVQ